MPHRRDLLFASFAFAALIGVLTRAGREPLVAIAGVPALFSLSVALCVVACAWALLDTPRRRQRRQRARERAALEAHIRGWSDRA